MAFVNITAGPKGVNLAGGGVEVVPAGATLAGTPADGEMDDLILCDWFAEVIEAKAVEVTKSPGKKAKAADDAAVYVKG